MRRPEIVFKLRAPKWNTAWGFLFVLPVLWGPSLVLGANPPSRAGDTGASEAPQIKLSDEDQKTLVRNLLNAQGVQVRAHQHRSLFELQEMQEAHKIRLRSWDAAERENKREFFLKNGSKEARNRFLETLRNRRRDFIKILEDEIRDRRQEQMDQEKKLVGQHKEQLEKLKTFISQGKKPPKDIWPQSGF